MEEGKEPALAAGEKQAGSNSRHNLDGTLNLYCGISACPKVSRQCELVNSVAGSYVDVSNSY
jgi:hypothetical protein